MLAAKWGALGLLLRLGRREVIDLSVGLGVVDLLMAMQEAGLGAVVGQAVEAVAVVEVVGEGGLDLGLGLGLGRSEWLMGHKVSIGLVPRTYQVGTIYCAEQLGTLLTSVGGKLV
jgi:hypothetical protein